MSHSQQITGELWKGSEVWVQSQAVWGGAQELALFKNPPMESDAQPGSRTTDLVKTSHFPGEEMEAQERLVASPERTVALGP